MLLHHKPLILFLICMVLAFLGNLLLYWVQTSVQSFLLNTLAWFTLLSLLATVGIQRFYQSFDKKIKQLTAIAAQIEQENYQQRLSVQQQNEWGYFATALNRLLQTLADKQSRDQTMQKLISPILVEQLLAQPQTTGQTCSSSLLSVKVHDFTHYLNNTPAQYWLTLLNDYFTRLNFCVIDHQGVSVQYVGERLLVGFGLCQGMNEHRQQAIQTALAMLRAVELFNLEQAAEKTVQFQIGIGISSGDVLTGAVGAKDHYQYSVLGDAVTM